MGRLSTTECTYLPTSVAESPGYTGIRALSLAGFPISQLPGRYVT